MRRCVIYMTGLTTGLVAVIVSTACWAQTPLPPQVIYSYDAGGNRIERAVILLGQRLADTTATEEIQEPPIEDGMVLVYPNPTDGNLTVSISPILLEEEENARYLVVDLSGKEIRKGQLVQSITTLDLTSEASGNYILTVFVGERREDWQLVKN